MEGKKKPTYVMSFGCNFGPLHHADSTPFLPTRSSLPYVSGPEGRRANLFIKPPSNNLGALAIPILRSMLYRPVIARVKGEKMSAVQGTWEHGDYLGYAAS